MGARQKAGLYGRALAAAVLYLSASRAAAAADPFNPGAFVQEKLARGEEPALLSRGIYRINGRRYLQYNATTGSIYLPAVGEGPELLAELAVCPAHLGLQREVIPLRRELAIDAATRKLEAKLIDMIKSCRDGRLAGPTVYERQPDGAIIERRAAAHTSDAASP